jgi:hypothetical protein
LICEGLARTRRLTRSSRIAFPRTVKPQQQRDQAQVADRRVSQQALQVVLEHRHVAAQQQRGQAGAADDPEPFLGARQHGPQPGQQEHAGLHHRGRVQVGRYRRGGGHGVRQPEVEGELRALGQRAQQHQAQRQRIERMGTHRVPRLQDGVELEAADDVAQDQHAGQQCQTAGGRDGEGHAGSAAGVLAVRPVADQQEGEDTGQLPEHHQLHQVARDHHAEHGAHETQQQRIEARGRVVGRQVVARVEGDQQAHAADQHREHPGEAVQPDNDVDAQAGHPGHALRHHDASTDLRVQHRQLHDHHRSKGGCAQRHQVAGVGGQQRGDRAADERKREKQEERHRTRVYVRPRRRPAPAAQISRFARSRSARRLRRRPRPSASCCPAGTRRARGGPGGR